MHFFNLNHALLWLNHVLFWLKSCTSPPKTMHARSVTLKLFIELICKYLLHFTSFLSSYISQTMVSRDDVIHRFRNGNRRHLMMSLTFQKSCVRRERLDEDVWIVCKPVPKSVWSLPPCQLPDWKVITSAQFPPAATHQILKGEPAGILHTVGEKKFHLTFTV